MSVMGRRHALGLAGNGGSVEPPASVLGILPGMELRAEEALRQSSPAVSPALSESEESLRLLVDAVTDYAIYMLDPEGRVVTWNAGAERSKGYKAEEVLGKSFSMFFLPDDVAAGLPGRELAVAAIEGRFAVDGWRRRKDGGKFWAQVTLTAIRGTKGELRGFAKVTRDMTAQKAADEAVRSRNAQLEHYRIIVENVTDYVIFAMDAEGKITSWDAGAQKESGVAAEQVLGRHFSMFFSPEDVAAGEPERELAEAARSGQFAVDGWRFTPQGRRLWSCSVLNAVRDERGELIGFVRVARVMTQQKEAEDALRKLNAELKRYRMMIDNIDEYAIYTLDSEGRITSWEAGAQKMTGTAPEEMLGKPYSMFFCAEDVRAGLPERDLAEAARAGRYLVDAWRFTPRGERVWSSSVINALRDETGKLTGYLRIARILTAQKEAEDALHALNAQLERHRIVVESVRDHVICTLDPAGHFDSWSPGSEKVLGYTADEALGGEYAMIFTAQEIEADQPRLELEEAAREGHAKTDGWRVRRGGELFWSSGETTAIRDASGQVTGFVRVARDMTRQKRMEESLGQLAADLESRVAERTRQLEDTVSELLRKNDEVETMAQTTARDLEEKKVMLNEIHHRVKNNLQVVQSLLKMSVRSLPEGEARAVTMTTAQRVYAMAMVHERLYQTQDLSGISVSTYVRDLFAGVVESNSALQGQIKLKLDADEIPLNLDQGIPFGLLVNELLANSLKHAFPNGRKGTVAVSIHRVPGAVCLAFKDDGIGLPENFNPARCTSMGLKLAASLAHQLGGSLSFSSDQGCRVETELTRL